jgi:hypothetical protein
VDNNNPGFTGYGFCNGNNAIGAGINWSVVVGTGIYTLTFRYANGTTTDRPANLLINGSPVVSGISFPGTGAWTTWTTVSRVIAMNAGTLTIRLEPTTANGLANIDYLMLTGVDVQPAACP